MEVSRRSDLVLKHHAKSFHFASHFLPVGLKGPVADLYSFCRYIDDVSDQEKPEIARQCLLDLRDRVAAGEVLKALEFEKLGIRRSWMLDLIDGALFDTQFRHFEHEGELDLYCYQVAGVVGLMMCPLLGVHDEKAWQHAVDLGSAMQLTNMARDVAEDAGRGRMYFPLSWLRDLEIHPHHVMHGQGVSPLVKMFLEKAEGLYRSGALGLPAIPLRQRGAIAVALTVYRGIGGALARQNYDPFAGRAYVAFIRKLGLACKGLIMAYWPSRRGKHETVAHNYAWRTARSLHGTLQPQSEVDRGQRDQSL